MINKTLLFWKSNLFSPHQGSTWDFLVGRVIIDSLGETWTFTFPTQDGGAEAFEHRGNRILNFPLSSPDETFTSVGNFTRRSNNPVGGNWIPLVFCLVSGQSRHLSRFNSGGIPVKLVQMVNASKGKFLAGGNLRFSSPSLQHLPLN